MTLSNDARFWDRSARRYAAAAVSDPRGYERTLRRTRELLEENDHVLELGCGTGSTALRLADGVASYLGTDFSPAMIAIAQKAGRRPVAALSFSPRRPRIRHCGPASTTRCWRSTICTWCAICPARCGASTHCWPTAACSSQDGVPGRHESVDPAGLAAGHARSARRPIPARSAPRRWSGSGRRRVRDPGDGTPRRRRQRPAAVHGRAQALSTPSVRRASRAAGTALPPRAALDRR